MKKLEPITIEKQESKGIDFQNIHDVSLVDPYEEIGRPPVAISIGTTTYKQNVYYTPFGTYGNFSSIVGPSKAGKSFLKSMLESAYLGGEAQNHFVEWRGHETEDKYLLSIDTEQSKYHTKRVQKRVNELVGSIPDNYKTFALREHETSYNIGFIEWLYMESEYKNKIGMMCIDGIADLLENVNDLDKSNEIVKKLMKWTTLGNSHIITVIHRNHGTMKPTGHLGSAVLKKSETVAFIEKENETMTVKCEYSRDIWFEPFKFRVNELWLPELLTDKIF